MFTKEHKRAQPVAGELTKGRGVTCPQGDAYCHETALTPLEQLRLPGLAMRSAGKTGGAGTHTLSSSNDSYVSVKLPKAMQSTRLCSHCASMRVPLDTEPSSWKNMTCPPTPALQSPRGAPTPPPRLPSALPGAPPSGSGVPGGGQAGGRSLVWTQGSSRPALAGAVLGAWIQSWPHGGRSPGQVGLRAQSTVAHHQLQVSYKTRPRGGPV